MAERRKRCRTAHVRYCEHIHSHLPYKGALISGIPIFELQALPRGHASPRTAISRLHVTHKSPNQRLVTHAVTTTAHRAPAALQMPPWMCATPYAAGRPSATVWVHAAASQCPPTRAGCPLQWYWKAGPQQRRQQGTNKQRASRERAEPRAAHTRACERAAPVDASQAPHQPRESRSCREQS